MAARDGPTRRLRELALGRMIGVFITGVCLTACRPPPPPPPADVLTWRTVGTWSGRGNGQTESFPIDTGSLRVRWQTRNEAPAGRGVFRVALHSAISGRPLAPVAEQRGVGDGMKEIDEDPRMFYLVVESASVDWTLTVEEGTLGKVAPKPAR